MNQKKMKTEKIKEKTAHSDDYIAFKKRIDECNDIVALSSIKKDVIKHQSVNNRTQFMSEKKELISLINKRFNDDNDIVERHFEGSELSDKKEKSNKPINKPTAKEKDTKKPKEHKQSKKEIENQIEEEKAKSNITTTLQRLDVNPQKYLPNLLLTYGSYVKAEKNKLEFITNIRNEIKSKSITKNKLIEDQVAQFEISIDDASLVPREFCSPSMQLINKFVSENKELIINKKLSIKGVSVNLK